MIEIQAREVVEDNKDRARDKLGKETLQKENDAMRAVP